MFNVKILKNNFLCSLIIIDYIINLKLVESG